LIIAVQFDRTFYTDRSYEECRQRRDQGEEAEGWRGVTMGKGEEGAEWKAEWAGGRKRGHWRWVGWRVRRDTGEDGCSVRIKGQGGVGRRGMEGEEKFVVPNKGNTRWREVWHDEWIWAGVEGKEEMRSAGWKGVQDETKYRSRRSALWWGVHDEEKCRRKSAG
jgi:hypothetical protein